MKTCVSFIQKESGLRWESHICLFRWLLAPIGPWHPWHWFQRGFFIKEYKKTHFEGHILSCPLLVLPLSLQLPYTHRHILSSPEAFWGWLRVFMRHLNSGRTSWPSWWRQVCPLNDVVQWGNTYSDRSSSPIQSSEGSLPLSAHKKKERDRKHLDDITSARLPPLHYSPVKLLSLDESAVLLQEQTRRQQVSAAESPTHLCCTSSVNIKLQADWRVRNVSI